MPTSATLRGEAEVMHNLNKEIADIVGATPGGLMAGGLIVQRAAQAGVPVEYGNLRASAFTRKAMFGGGLTGALDLASGLGSKPAVEVGFTASYALFVHEDMEMKLAGKPRPSGLGVYWGPHGRPQFLILAAHEKSDEVLDAIKSRVKK